MEIKAIHPNFMMPTKGTSGSAGFDLYMPTDGQVFFGEDRAIKVRLGFAASVPEGHVALLLPRSGVGAKKGLELNNTCGVIDSDYRGEWMAAIRTKNTDPIVWEAGDRLLQFIIVPAPKIELTQVTELTETSRGVGGLGSTGKD